MRSQSVHAVPECARGPRVCMRPQSVHAAPECAHGHRVCMWSQSVHAAFECACGPLGALGTALNLKARGATLNQRREGHQALLSI
jgi:hypothetical protein